jgi:peptidoglycan biosynthesis protein MviN/MurJ (putative lipid II flippase)
MEATDELLTIAELAIGLAGFSGIVVAFSPQRGLRDVARFYFIALITCSFTAVLLAFLPSFFHHGGVVGTAMWKSSSVVMLFLYVLVIAGLGIRVSRTPSVYEAHHLGIHASIGVCTAALLTAVCIIMNIVGYPMEPGATLYLVGLFLWLTVTAFMFTYLVLVGSQEQDARVSRPKVSNEVIRD